MPTTYGNDIVYCPKSHCGVRGYCRKKWVLQVQIIANSVMRGRVNAIRTFKGLVADLRKIILQHRKILSMLNYNKKQKRLFPKIDA